MTRMTPRRFTTLQCSHNFFTDALTFILNFCFNQNPPHAQIVRRQLQFHFVAGFQTGKILLRFSRDERRQAVSVFQFRAPGAVRQNLGHATVNFESFVSGHVKISGSPSVIRTVCSKWADSEPSCDTTVQPSFKIFTSGRPALTIGSIAIVIPAPSLSFIFRSTKFGTCGSSCIVRPTPWPTNSRTTLKPLPST